MAARKPGFTDTDTNRNKRDNRLVPATDNVDSQRHQGSDPTNNKNRNRFLDMPITP
jgi:hypothetical protein